MDGYKQECKLCDKIVSDEDCKVIEDVIKSVLDVLLLKLKLDNETQNVMCTMCTSKLLSALNFKSTCLDTDDTLFPYINFENPTPLDLEEIYVKEKARKRRGRKIDNGVICRLCLHPISSDVKSIQDVPLETIQIYIPEIDFSVTRNPVICIKCHDALCVHSSFIKNCLEVEKGRYIVAMDVGDSFLTDPCIKTEEIEVKDEQVDDGAHSESLCNLEKQENEEGDTSLDSQNDLVGTEESKSAYLKPTSAESTPGNSESGECIYNSTSQSRSAGRESQPKNDSETQADEREGSNGRTKRQCVGKDQVKSITKQKNRCDKCVFKTSNRKSLKRHQLIHKGLSEVQTYKCNECEYETKRKDSLKEHCLTHRHPSEIRMHKCSHCSYKAKRRDCLKRHQLTHQDPSEVQMYDCNECRFVTKRKESLIRHQLTHKHPSEIQMYECSHCGYKTKRKDYLRKHQLTHEESSKVECYKCKFTYRHKSSLITHLLTHKHPSEIQMYECSRCSYKTKIRSSLKKHQLTHRDPSENRMHECSRCSHKTKRKGDLKAHLLRHKRSFSDSNVQVQST